MIFTATLTFDL